MNALSLLSTPANSPASDAALSDAPNAAASPPSSSENGSTEADNFSQHISELTGASAPDDETEISIALGLAQSGLQSEVTAELGTDAAKVLAKMPQPGLTATKTADFTQVDHDLPKPTDLLGVASRNQLVSEGRPNRATENMSASTLAAAPHIGPTNAAGDIELMQAGTIERSALPNRPDPSHAQPIPAIDLGIKAARPLTTVHFNQSNRQAEAAQILSAPPQQSPSELLEQTSKSGLAPQAALANTGDHIAKTNPQMSQTPPGQVTALQIGSPSGQALLNGLNGQQNPLADEVPLSLRQQIQITPDQNNLPQGWQPGQTVENLPHKSIDMTAAFRTPTTPPDMRADRLFVQQLPDIGIENLSQDLQLAAIGRDAGASNGRLQTPDSILTALNVNDEGNMAMPNIAGPFANLDTQQQLSWQLALPGLQMANSPLSSSALSVMTQGSAQQLSAANLSNLGQGLVQAAKSNKGIAVQLDPPELGRVYIDFQFETGRGVTAVIRPEFADTSQLLQDQSNWLSQTLSSSGFDKVNIQFAAPDNQGFAFTDQDSPAGGELQTAYEADNQDEAAELSPRAGIINTMMRYAQTSGGPLNIKL